MPQKTGAEIRQEFIDFFVKKHGHTFVPSSSLVPGGDATLLFTNAGMVQFKDVFLGTDKRPYTRAANSQKCMRVAGKHNDLDDVGRDDTHHTFFEMLGNWSFGDYYKKEAIAWAWELLTEVWGLDKSRLYATVFKDEKGEIPTDEEAARYWLAQPGFIPTHLMYFGRKDNFWEMADTGPCGPCSEIHIDRGPEFCDMQDVPGHECCVNGNCARFLELWNLVFIQYNRLGASHLEPLPATHVDTGMGFERIVAVMQDKTSNYRTDLLWPLIQTTQRLTGHNDAEREANFTPYRVIADHARAAAFLIADGVVPGNTGRNYICRMIIRRAARFGGKIGLHDPFLAQVADVVVQNYGAFYPELRKNRSAILDAISREEERFQHTVESGMARLQTLLDALQQRSERILPGEQAFDLYATYGLPLEISRDVAREQGLDVEENGFHQAMEAHRLASGAGEAFGPLGGEDSDLYRQIFEGLRAEGKLPPEGVAYDPYSALEVEGPILALVRDGQPVESANPGDTVEVTLPATCFYVAAGGQVSDTGTIVTPGTPSPSGRWELRVVEMRKPAAGMVVHVCEVLKGHPKVGDTAIAAVDAQRRSDIVRNHTATHLLHAALHEVLGEHARQAGSLVAPDRLRFDFTHPEAVTPAQLAQIEHIVNMNILGNYPLRITWKSLQEAKAEGAMALFGEKYGETVRTIAIGEPETFSYELCGGTHVRETGDIGLFLIVSEGSAAAGVRRIEAITGRGAYAYARGRINLLDRAAVQLHAKAEQLPERVAALQEELHETRKQLAQTRTHLLAAELDAHIAAAQEINGIRVLTLRVGEADADALRTLADRFRERQPQNGVAVFASVNDNRPSLLAAVTEDLTQRGLHAGKLVKFVAQQLGGGGGGKPTLAQAGGKDASKLDEALASVAVWVEGGR
ncbi:MAG: alanine--tRNA ligase [Anaerolineales bacterium]